MLKKLISIVVLLSTAVNTSAAAADNNYVVGLLVPAKQVVIRSEVGGVVDAYYKKVGSRVEQGENLLALSVEDNTLSVELAKYELDVSQSELNAQEKQLKRYQSLYKTKGISASVFDEQRRVTDISRAQFNVSSTKYDIARRFFAKSTPDSPFNGIILTRSVELGQFISVGDPLYTVIDMSVVKVRFYLLESDLSEVAEGDKVEVKIPSLQQSVTGRVTLVSPAFQAQDPGFMVEVDVNNPKGELKPGMQAHVILEDSKG
ncbi:efflux RND transporter periplasmic adaptor subunit [Psychromonas aquimarina]|uniref:efflux RND transporter periplasmic adaptor subunit n=1 Tax=Psychromonas aquimarina TaxID=444919 RepID=UPI0004295A98|nr:efflux RND transporter periplasmic adaptor subunit [Psychromonas aquimarina]